MKMQRCDGTTEECTIQGHTATHESDDKPRHIVKTADGKKYIFIGFILPPRVYAAILLLCEQEKCTFDEALEAALTPLFRAADVASGIAN